MYYFFYDCTFNFKLACAHKGRKKVILLEVLAVNYICENVPSMIFDRILNTCLVNITGKVSEFEVFSGPYFPTFRLNTEINRVNLRIQSSYGKIQTRKKKRIPTLFLQWKILTLRLLTSLCYRHCLVLLLFLTIFLVLSLAIQIKRRMFTVYREKTTTT